MVKIHLWKSELAVILAHMDYALKKTKPTGIELEMIQSVRKKLLKAYNKAER